MGGMEESSITSGSQAKPQLLVTGLPKAGALGEISASLATEAHPQPAILTGLKTFQGQIAWFRLMIGTLSRRLWTTCEGAASFPTVLTGNRTFVQTSRSSPE